MTPLVSPTSLELLDLALHAARAGSQTLREGYGQALDIHDKGSIGDLVTDVDVAAETAVRQVLIARRPADIVTGEELAPHPGDGALVRWSIDPLDGTTNYTRRIPYFATSIAAFDLQLGFWVAGVVDAPLLGRVYYAARGAGAWLVDEHGIRRLTGPAGQTSARLLGVGLSYDAHVRETQSTAFQEHMRGYTDCRALGSAALATCAVADGSLDAYLESDLAEYDWAAGALVAEEAGLRVARPSSASSMLSITQDEIISLDDVN